MLTILNYNGYSYYNANLIPFSAHSTAASAERRPLAAYCVAAYCVLRVMRTAELRHSTVGRETGSGESYTGGETCIRIRQTRPKSGTYRHGWAKAIGVRRRVVACESDLESTVFCESYYKGLLHFDCYGAARDAFGLGPDTERYIAQWQINCSVAEECLYRHRQTYACYRNMACG